MDGRWAQRLLFQTISDESHLSHYGILSYIHVLVHVLQTLELLFTQDARVVLSRQIVRVQRHSRHTHAPVATNKGVVTLALSIERCSRGHVEHCAFHWHIDRFVGVRTIILCDFVLTKPSCCWRRFCRRLLAASQTAACCQACGQQRDLGPSHSHSTRSQRRDWRNNAVPLNTNGSAQTFVSQTFVPQTAAVVPKCGLRAWSSVLEFFWLP